VVQALKGPLKAHIPIERGKYERSGHFTKEERASRAANARPYRKSGNHINDYQNPRNKELRDAQLAARAKALGVSVDVMKSALLAK
jgi:hypothetical protein